MYDILLKMIDNRVLMETIWQKLNHQIIQQVFEIKPYFWVIAMRSKTDGILILNFRNEQPAFSIQHKIDSALLSSFLHPGLTDKLKGFTIQNVRIENDLAVVLDLKNLAQYISFKIQLAPYAPRFQLIQSDLVLFDSILGWKPIDMIKSKPSMLVSDPSIKLESIIRHSLSLSYLQIIKKTLERKNRKQEALMQDLKHHQLLLGYQTIAEAIQTQPNQPWKDYANPYHLLPPYQQFKTDFAGANELFSIFKKAKKGMALTQTQIKLNHELIQEMIPFTVMVPPLNQKDLEILRTFLEKEHLLSAIEGKPTEVQHLSPYYVDYKGIRISYGKNAKQNDHLTFHLAKKNEIFMHIEGKPGSHVVIHHHQFDHDLLIIGSQLVLALAKQMAGTVTYAKVGSLKQTKTPGQVIIKDAKTIKVNADSLLSLKLLETSKRY